MRYTTGMVLVAGLALSVPAVAQDDAAAKKQAEKELKRKIDAACGRFTGIIRMDCIEEQKKTAAGGGPVVSAGQAAEQKLAADALNSGNAKQSARDYSGALVEYQRAIDTAPKNPFMPQLRSAMATALRNQAVTAYNSAGQPTIPPFGASDAEIRAANKANADLQAKKAAAAVPLLRRAIAEAATAATIADPKKNAAILPSIQVELREDAALLFRIDRDATMATARPSVDTEVTWYRNWLAATPGAPVADVAKYGYGVAAALHGKDRAAGLALADEVYAKTSADMGAKLDYADLIAAAKLPVGDARRAKALADVTVIESGSADPAQKARAARLKTALKGPV